MVKTVGPLYHRYSLDIPKINIDVHRSRANFVEVV